MPRWKALPEELDPQVREFAGQLRRLVDRSGLSVAALADATGYSKTSWERYLNGRLLPPQRAVVALAEATGANPAHLTTLWELAERAWSRDEMRQDVTMEAISVAQARAALGWDADQAEPPAKSAKFTNAKFTKGTKAAPASGTAQPPRVPQQRRTDSPSAADFPQWAAVAGPSPAAAPADQGPARRTRRGRILMAAAGVALVAGAAFLLLNPGSGTAKKAAAPRPAAAPSAKQVLPAGVRCTGAGCVGKDPEAMGCGGGHATTPSRGRAGRAVIEVRYSKICHTAWARISQAAPGDQATLSAGGHSATARAERNGAAYTPMVEVTGDPAKVAACGTTVAGVKGCSRPVPATPAGAPAPSAGAAVR
ncbi:helix-turn-helix domain-containing protein [Streptomyces sp. bgisy084]|uniref:helix-turn-helix domain-containing protein n=1 Tax=Streptomyces sp. bgisy084 TaxID=3413777 RepID=UPI003D763E0A